MESKNSFVGVYMFQCDSDAWWTFKITDIREVACIDFFY